MAGLGGAIAQGFESGYGLGLKTDAANETKRRNKFEEGRQVDADTRAAADLDIRQRRESAAEDRATAADRRQRGLDAATMLSNHQKELAATSGARQAAGMPVDPADAEAYGQNAEALKRIRTQALNYWSQAQTGNADPVADAAANPDQVRLNLTAATGMLPEQIAGMPQHIQKIQAGLESGNTALTVEGANGLLAPQLQRGVGTESPHGGTIVRKEIIGLDPAKGGDGRDHPERVIPRLRVYVDHPDQTGPKMADGSNGYYDAPMSAGGGSDDAPAAIDLKRAMDYMGNLGVTAQALQHPGMAGVATPKDPANDSAKKYLDDLSAAGKMAVPRRGAASDKVQAAREMVDNGEAADVETALQMIATRGAPKPPAPETPLQASQRKLADARTAAVTKKAGLGTGATSGAPAAPGAGAKSAALGGAAAPAKTDDAIDFWAKAVIAGDRDWQIGIGRSKTGAALIEAVKRRVPVLAKEMNLEPQDIGTTRAMQAALTATTKDLTKRSEAVDLFASKVEKDMGTFDAALTKAGLDSPLLINKPINALRRSFSDPDLAQLDLAAKQVGAEYERLITGGTLSVAQLHAGASEDAKKLINGDMPPKQARAVMETMRLEMKNARDAAHESTARIQEKMRGLGRARGVGDAAPAAAPGKFVEGKVYQDASGNKAVYQGGKWVPQ